MTRTLIPAFFVILSLLNQSLCTADWKCHQIQKLNGKSKCTELSAQFQLVSEKWVTEQVHIARVPYLVYMPEKKQLLMLASFGEPLSAVVSTSNDFGNRWTEPLQKTDNAVGAGLSLSYLGNGKIMFYACRSYWHSSDFGQNWKQLSNFVRVSDGSPWYGWDPFLVDRDSVKGEVIRLLETGHNTNPGYSQAYLRTSFDEGRTWVGESKVPQWQYVNEVALLRAKNGDIVAACRTDKTKKFKDEWLDHYCGLAISISRDNGQTWSELNRLYEWGRHHPSMVLLDNGDIVMTYVVRLGYVDTVEGYPQFGIEAIVSRDNGRSWDFDHRYMLLVWQGTQKTDKRWWSSCQNTSSVLLPDGSIITAFGTGQECRRTKAPQSPWDIGLVKWCISDEGPDPDMSITNAPYDSNLRNVFDPIITPGHK